MAWPEMIAHARDLERIREALHEAGAILRHFSRHRATVSAEAHDSPVTDAEWKLICEMGGLKKVPTAQ